jgi:hypothetical protein
MRTVYCGSGCSTIVSMNPTNMRHIALILAGTAGLTFAVYSQEENPVEKGAKATGETIKHGVHATERTVGKGVKKAGETVEQAGEPSTKQKAVHHRRHRKAAAHPSPKASPSPSPAEAASPSPTPASEAAPTPAATPAAPAATPEAPAATPTPATAPAPTATPSS